MDDAWGGAVLWALLSGLAVSWLVLALYRRRVARALIQGGTQPSEIAGATAMAQSSSAAGTNPRRGVAWRALGKAAVDHQNRLMVLYLLGGAMLAAALTTAHVLEPAQPSPLTAAEIVHLFASSCAPLALTLRTCLGRWKQGLVLWAVLFVISAVAARFTEHRMHPDVGAEAFTLMLVLALMLHPRVRAMAPVGGALFGMVLVSAFGAAAFVGMAHFDLAVFKLNDPEYVQHLAELRAIPADRLTPAKLAVFQREVVDLWRGIATLAGLALVAATLIGVVFFLAWTRAYARKRTSEQWLLVAPPWTYFAITVAPRSAFGVAMSLAAVICFHLVVRLVWRHLRARSEPGVTLLLLRSFALGERSERLLRDLEHLWRNVGSIQLVGGPDIALGTLEPHELIDFLRGRWLTHFACTPSEVDARLARFDFARDPDGRFRINDLFCSDAVWQHAVGRLLSSADCVLMDLRGFNRHRAGCVFEIRHVLQLGVIDRVVFLVDEATDRAFIAEICTATLPGHPRELTLRFVADDSSTPDHTLRVMESLERFECELRPIASAVIEQVSRGAEGHAAQHG